MTTQNPRHADSVDGPPPVILPRPLGLTNAALLVVGYVALDWVSYIRPLHDLNITPWNPAPALGLVFLLRYGKSALIPLVVALLAADIGIRGTQIFPLGGLLGIWLAAGYWGIGAVLGQRLPGGDIFHSPRQLAEWGGIVIAGTLVISLVFVMVYWIAGIIQTTEMLDALQRHWVGDAVGILVSMPIIWVLFDEHGRSQMYEFIRTMDFVIVVVLTGLALWVAFGLGSRAEFKYLYVLFLPIAFAAARHRLEGAVIGATIMQIGIIGAVQYLKLSAVTIVEIQWLVLVLAVFGFFIGVVVSERERMSRELRQTLRMAAAGEMAAALAHELNQPLAALTAYGAACEKMLLRGDAPDKVASVVHSLVSESFRAGEIVRRLRDFFRFGTSKMEPLDIRQLIQDTTAQFMERSRAEQVQLEVSDDGAHIVLADKLQIEVVMRNLLANAFDATKSIPSGLRRVQVQLSAYGPGLVSVTVTDSGLGVSTGMADRLFEPFQTTKASGMGLGLAVSRSMVQAHGGNLWVEAARHGVFRFTLPTAAEREGKHS